MGGRLRFTRLQLASKRNMHQPAPTGLCILMLLPGIGLVLRTTGDVTVSSGVWLGAGC